MYIVLTTNWNNKIRSLELEVRSQKFNQKYKYERFFVIS